MAIWNKDTQSYLSNNKTLFEAVVVAPFVSAGLPAGQQHINKFGFTGTDVNGTATVWDADGTTALYPYPSSGVVAITSSSGTDTGEAVEVQGLDGDYNQVTEDINVGATGTTTFSRIFRARMKNTTNVGIITINQGASLAAQILAGNGQTLMAVYTIPAGKTGYLIKFQGSADKSTAVKFKFFARPFGEAFNLKGQWGTQGGNPVTYDYPIPLSFAEKTDLKIDVETAANCGCGAIFDVLLVDNN
jgi:hypothetical protein